jgi:hypothetical protein
MDCEFCDLPADRLIADAPLCVTARDRFPVSNGHTLIIPKRHVASAFELTSEEHGAIRTFSSGANFLLVRRRISRTAASVDCFFFVISRLSPGPKTP